MKILILTAYRVIGIQGGLATVVRNLSSFLRKSGHETEMISFDILPKAFKVMAYLPYDFLNEYFFRLGVLWAIIFKSLVYFPLILAKCLSKPYDVINVHDAESALFVKPISRLFKIPIVLTIHGPLKFNDPKWFKPPLSQINSKILESACHEAYAIIVLSRSEEASLLTLNESLKKKIVIVPNGVDLESIQRCVPAPLEGDPSVIYVGGLGWIKGVDLLVKAFKTVNDALPSSFLHIFGEGPQRQELELIAVSFNIWKNVRFHGVIVPAYVYFKAADIVVVPSRVEAFGIVALEAMAAGKPVVVSNVGGLKELVKDFENGLLVSPTPENIAEKLVMLWKNPELRERLGRNALDTAQKYSWENIVERYLEVFESAHHNMA